MSDDDLVYGGILAHATKHRQIYCPIITTPDGQIIEGHTRMRVADELGIDCPTWVVETDNPERLGAELNALRRRPSRAERRAGFRYLKETTGMSDTQIGKVTGYSRPTVTADLAHGKNLPPGQAELERLRAEALALSAEGRTVEWIAVKQDCSESTVRRRLGKKAPSSSYTKKAPRSIPTPEPAYTPPAETELYQRSVVLELVRDYVAHCTHGNFVNKLSHDVMDAGRAKDTEWLTDAKTALLQVMSYTQRLLDVVNDPAAAERGRTWDERDDFAQIRDSQLRVVR